MSMAGLKLFFLVSSLYMPVLVSCQYGQSPCPDIFEYRTDGDNVYGWIELRPTAASVSVITLMVDFTVATRLGSNYVGRIEPAGSELQLLQEYNRGRSIGYRIHFPVTSPLPRLTSVTVNGNLLCRGAGDSISAGRYVTTIRLQHTLYLKSGSVPSNSEWARPPAPAPAAAAAPAPTYPAVVTSNRDSILYTFGDIELDDNRNGVWSSDVPESFAVNTTRPVPPPSPPQSPVYELYPGVQQRPRPRPTAHRPHTMQTMPPQPTEPLIPPRQIPTPTSPSNPPHAAIQCGVISGGNERIPLIFNGQAIGRGDWPWLVAIYKRKDSGLTFICAGTLISERHIVSAAHCIRQKNTRTETRDVVVKVGVFNLQDWGDDMTLTRTVTAATYHQSYNPNTLANDILVITLEKTVTFNNNIRPACLWDGDIDLTGIVGMSGMVVGWGDSELGPGGHGEPRTVRMPIVSTAACRASRPDFHKLTSSTTLCAGDRNGSGPCLGDSGGGLYILEDKRWRLRGVVSLALRADSGENTCNLNEYIVFTDTAQYLPWITKVMK